MLSYHSLMASISKQIASAIRAVQELVTPLCNLVSRLQRRWYSVLFKIKINMQYIYTHYQQNVYTLCSKYLQQRSIGH